MIVIEDRNDRKTGYFTSAFHTCHDGKGSASGRGDEFSWDESEMHWPPSNGSGSIRGEGMGIGKGHGAGHNTKRPTVYVIDTFC